MKTLQRLLTAASMAVVAILSTSCSSDGKKDEYSAAGKTDAQLRAEANAYYKDARKTLDDQDYASAIEKYDRISTRYPFTEYGTQAQLEKVYALYRSLDADKAEAAAERFLREHPRHAYADYVQYLKALVNFDRETSLARFLHRDDSKGDVGYDRKAFDDFALLVQRYPQSPYLADARGRMIYLRNRVAQHELNIVDFYMRRGAYVAAAKRAEQIIAQYPGAPQTYEVLDVLEEAYRKAGLQQHADDVAKLRQSQGPAAAAP